MRLERIATGRPVSPAHRDGVLARDLVAGEHRLHKGHRLTDGDLALIAAQPVGEAVPVLLPDPGEVHEDEAAIHLASVVAGEGSGLVAHGPVRSRMDLLAKVAGVVEIRVAALERLNRIDMLEVFTVFDGQVVAVGELVASVKVAPLLVPASALAAGEMAARRAAPLIRVRPFRPARFAAIAKGPGGDATRSRFEAAVSVKAAGLGAAMGSVAHVPGEPGAVTEALAAAIAGPEGATIVLAAGGAGTDPSDAFFTAIAALGGRVVRHGVPAHPGSMLWLATVGRTVVVGLPSCGAFSMATAADLLLPLLVAGYPPTVTTIARLAHGGILARTQRFRFPAYARDLDTPSGPDT